MNRYDEVGPKLGLVRVGRYTVNYPVSDTFGLLIGEDFVQFVIDREKDGIGLDRILEIDNDEAIEAAKAILLKYRVPFCNRVKNDTD